MGHRAHEAGPVERKTDREVLQGNVVYELIVAALQEGRVYGCEGLHAFGGQPSPKVTACRGDAHVETTLRELFRENIDARAARHGRRDRNNLIVLAALFHEGFPEDLGVAWMPRLALILRARNYIELRHTVILVLAEFSAGA